MAEEFLDVPDIDSTSKEMGSDAVAKRYLLAVPRGRSEVAG